MWRQNLNQEEFLKLESFLQSFKTEGESELSPRKLATQAVVHGKKIQPKPQAKT